MVLSGSGRTLRQPGEQFVNRTRKKKVLFFEKKKQKTFAR